MEENQVQETVQQTTPVQQPKMGFWAKRKEKKLLKDQLKKQQKQQKQEQKETKKAAKEYSKLTKEQIYLKSLFEVEQVVNHCKKKGWTTKEDWRTNAIPMKEMVTDLIRKTNEYYKEKEKEFVDAYPREKN